MSLTKRHFYILILVLLAGLTCYWLYNVFVDDEATQKELSHYPAEFMVNMHVTQFNSAGQTSVYVDSPRVYRFENTIVNLIEPSITIFNSDGSSPWLITARFGQSKEQSKLVNLWDHVVIHRNASAKNKEVTILLPEVTYNMKTHFATSDQSVYFKQDPNDVMQGIGVRADLKNNVVNLLANVRGVYVPTPKPTTTNSTVNQSTPTPKH